MALITNRPPGSSHDKDCTTVFHAGVVSIMAWARKGGVSVTSPAQLAPRLRAKDRSALLLANTMIFDCRNRWRAIIRTRWPDAPKPVNPNVWPSWSLVNRRDR